MVQNFVETPSEPYYLVGKVRFHGEKDNKKSKSQLYYIISRHRPAGAADAHSPSLEVVKPGTEALLSKLRQRLKPGRNARFFPGVMRNGCELTLLKTAQYLVGGASPGVSSFVRSGLIKVSSKFQPNLSDEAKAIVKVDPETLQLLNALLHDAATAPTNMTMKQRSAASGVTAKELDGTKLRFSSAQDAKTFEAQRRFEAVVSEIDGVGSVTLESKSLIEAFAAAKEATNGSPDAASRLSSALGLLTFLPVFSFGDQESEEQDQSDVRMSLDIDEVWLESFPYQPAMYCF